MALPLTWRYVIAWLGMGRLAGHSWAEVFADYDVTAGRLWILVPLWTFVGPWVMYRLGRRG